MEKHDDIFDGFTYMCDPLAIAPPAPVPAPNVITNYSDGYHAGDLVRIVRAPYSGNLREISWPLAFNTDMYSMVGAMAVIVSVAQDGCHIKTPASGIINAYPNFCLERVGGDKPHKAEKTTTTDYTTKHEHCGFKIGDRVLIKRAPKDSDPKGFTIWENWQSNKLYSHGRIVDSLPSGFVVRFSDYDNEDSEDQGMFPYFVLQKF